MGNQEEVSFITGSPDSHLLPHNCGTNGRIAIYVCLGGCSGSRLDIHTDIDDVQSIELRQGRTFAFNDGWTHEFIVGPKSVHLLMVGIMHPDIGEWSFAEAFNGRTADTVFQEGELTRFKKAKKKRDKDLKKRRKRKKKKREEVIDL